MISSRLVTTALIRRAGVDLVRIGAGRSFIRGHHE